jgi:hypothetical protein
MKKDFILNNIKEVQAIEKVSPKVSERYVPIYTTELIEALAPEFEFVQGYKFGRGTGSKHYITLKNKDNDCIRIYNSFDASLAFRAYLVSDDIQFSIVDENRVIHTGDKARSLGDKDHIQEIKEAIIKAIPNTKLLSSKLKDTEIDLDSEIADKIKEAISKYKMYHYIRSKKRTKKAEKDVDVDVDYEFVNYTDDVVKKLQDAGKNISIYSYINLSIKNFLQGNYGIKNTKTQVVSSGNPVKSVTNRIIITNNVAKVLEKDYFEYLI